MVMGKMVLKLDNVEKMFDIQYKIFSNTKNGF